MSLGVEDGRFEKYASELRRIEQAFDVSPELRDLWLNPANDRPRRMATVDQLVGPLELSTEVTNLLKLLVERQRLADLPGIVHAYQELVDERAGRVRATITTAVVMPADVTERLGRAIEAMTQKQIILESKVDPKLLGGVVTQVGGTVLDGSLRTQLEQLRKNMLTARL
jgi:F-type H+-transporting ATPase subunit delta